MSYKKDYSELSKSKNIINDVSLEYKSNNKNIKYDRNKRKRQITPTRFKVKTVKEEFKPKIRKEDNKVDFNRKMSCCNIFYNFLKFIICIFLCILLILIINLIVKKNNKLFDLKGQNLIFELEL